MWGTPGTSFLQTKKLIETLWKTASNCRNEHIALWCNNVTFMYMFHCNVYVCLKCVHAYYDAHMIIILNCSNHKLHSVQFSSVTQSCPTLCDSMNCSTPGLPVHHKLPEFTQTHVHQVGDAIQAYYPLSSPSPPALNLSQHRGLFQWVSSSHQVAKVLEFQLQHQSFQWTPRTDLL